ncbi:putative PEP-binding protein [Shigella flexneri]
MFIIDQCCEEIDFFSIGRIYLTQYLLAVDCDNAKVNSSLQQPELSLLAVLDYAVQAVHRQANGLAVR